MKAAIGLMFAILLVSCGSGQAVRLESQRWENLEVTVEIRPAPLRAGHAEFLIIATDVDRTPANDVVVSLRVRPDAAWQQAMQDGTMGVYRRALTLLPGDQTLYVQLRRRLAQTILEYPITVG